MKRFALFIAGILCLIQFSAQSQEFTYTTNNGTITITGHNGPDGMVHIPNEINGLPLVMPPNLAQA